MISALLFSTLIDKGELGSCFSCPSRSPSPDGEELSRLSVVVRRADVASRLSCPELRAFSSARTAIKQIDKISREIINWGEGEIP